MQHSFIIVCVVSLFAAGCSKPVPPTSAFESPAPLNPVIVEAATLQGKKIVSQAFQLLSTNLQNAIQQGGISNALPYCSIAALPLTQSVGQSQGVTVRRLTHKPRNPRGKADDFETAVLKSFESALALTNTPALLVTNVTPGKVTFLAPIVLSSQLCLKCHGQPGKDILPENLALIHKLYPQDQAQGFKIGDLRGAWRVDFPIAALEQATP